MPNLILGGEDSSLLEHSVLAAFVYQHFKIITAIRSKSLADYYLDLYIDGRPSWEQAKTSIRELKKICEERNLPLIAVLVPELHDFSEDCPYTPVYGKIGELFDEEDIPMIDTFSAMAATFNESHEQAWIAQGDPHPNSRAHQVIADVLYEHIYLSFESELARSGE